MALSGLSKMSRQPSPKLKEWILTEKDCTMWASVIRRNDPPVHSDKELQSYLSESNLFIGPNTFSSGFILVLHQACRSGDVDTVRYIVKHHEGQFVIDQLILQCETKFMCPTTSVRDMSILDKKNHVRESLMHAAVERASVDILKILVSNGAALETTDCCGKTPLMKAIEKHSLESRFWGGKVLTEYYNTILYLIQAGANVNCQDNDGFTTLMYLEDFPESISLVQVLVKAGANFQLKNNSGHTAIHDAVLQGKIKILAELMSFQSLVDLSLTDTSVPHPLLLLYHARIVHDQIHDFSLSGHDVIHDFSLSEVQKFTDLFVNCPHHITNNLLLMATYTFYIFLKKYECVLDQYVMFINKPIIAQMFQLFEQAIVNRSRLNIPLPSSEPYDAYGGLVEILSLDELGDCVDYSQRVEETIINLAYQCLIIRERCLGYGDTSLITFLFNIGEWMLTKFHDEGLLLLLRGSNMLLSQLEGGNVSMLESYLCLVRSGIDLSYSHNYSIEQFEQPDVFSLLVNLIKCLGLCIDLHKRHHYHTGGPKFKHCIRVILSSLHTYKTKFSCSTNVEKIGKILITKCPVYVQFEFCDLSPTNILHTAIVMINDIDFISTLLLWGGDSVVNEVYGPVGNRLLHLCNDHPEMVELLLQHGAHLDAVNIKRKSAFPANSLQCLCAHTIIKAEIPYDTLDLPKHIKQLIAFHDPQDVNSKIKKITNSLI